MSHRAGIAKAITDGINNSLIGTGLYYNDIMDNAMMGNKHFQDVSQWPLVTISPGPETRVYMPAGYTECRLNLYIRIYTRDENSSQQQVETLISDIETYLDNNLDLTYNVDTPNGNLNNHKTVTNTIISINTSEGLLSPDEIGEIAVEIRYDKIRGTN